MARQKRTKTGGRKTGTKNKVTANLREWVKIFISGNTQQIEQDWQLLDPKDRIILFEKLLKYTLPTLQSTELKTDFESMTDDQLDYIIDTLKQKQ